MGMPWYSSEAQKRVGREAPRMAAVRSIEDPIKIGPLKDPIKTGSGNRIGQREWTPVILSG